MKKLLAALAALVIVACHTENTYVFDVPKILAMDGRKIPEILGTPYKTTLPQSQNDGTGIYQYTKQEYAISIFYNYTTGLIGGIQIAKIIPATESANIDVNKEKADLPTKLNLKNIDMANFQVDTIGVLQEPNAPTIIHTSVHLAEASQTSVPSVTADSTTTIPK